MILILTEKPSVAKDIAAIFDCKSGDGFYSSTGSNNVLNSPVTITWAFGHLLSLDCDFPKQAKLTDLPVIPEFKYKPNDSGRKQLSVIRQLIKNSDSVIIATDSGREGELIARLILNHCSWKGWNKTKRFWTSEALTPEVIKANLKNAKPAVDYDGLYNSSLARQHGDWIVGLNLSSATSITAKGFYSIGRVQTPTLRLIDDRVQLIKNFIPSDYYVINGKFSQNSIQYDAELIIDKELELSNQESLDLVNQIEPLKDSAKISSIDKTKESKFAPPLHSLTSLQQEANTSFGYSAADTLKYAQDLYEKHKLISYPRTDSNYMSESSKGMVQTILQKLNCKIDISIDQIGKRVFDDSKLTDHYAVIPLEPDTKNLSTELSNIYNLIYRRFQGVFLNPLIEEKFNVITTINSFEFKSTGKNVLQLGWKSLYKLSDIQSEETQDLSKLNEGPVAALSVFSEKKTTQPKKQFTEASLLGQMEKLGLGTPATRADIIEKLIKRDYISRNKKNLITTDKGSELVHQVHDRDFSDPELTAIWEDKLTLITTNKTNYRTFIDEISEFTSKEIKEISSLSFSSGSGDKKATPKMLDLAKKLAKQHNVKYSSESFQDISEFINKYLNEKVDLGKCQCSGEIQESQKGYYCPSCKSTVWKESYGRKFSQSEAIKLLNGEMIHVKGLKKKDSKDTYSAKMNLKDGKLAIVEFLK